MKAKYRLAAVLLLGVLAMTSMQVRAFDPTGPNVGKGDPTGPNVQSGGLIDALCRALPNFCR